MARQCVRRRRACVREGPLAELGPIRGTEKSEDDGRRPERDYVAGCTMLLRYAGQRPVALHA